MASPEELLITVQTLNKAEKYQEVIDLLPDSLLETYNSADLYAEKAQSYYRLRKNDLCSEAVEKALLIDPEQAKANHYKGNIYSGQREYDKAIKAYFKAIEADPKFTYPYSALANIYRKQKQYEKAIEFYLKGIILDPKDAYPHDGLGNVYSDQKQYQKAIEEYNKAIELDPKEASPYNGLGNAYADLKQYQKAFEAYNKAIELDPKYEYPYNGLGNAYADLKQYEKAIEAYNKAIELDPEYASPYNGLGILYYTQTQYEKAIEAYNKVIELDPKDAFPYNGLGNVYYKQDQYEKAIEAYNKAIELDPKDSTAYYNRAITYFYTKEYKKALPDYVKYAELTNHSPDFYTSLAKDRISEIKRLILDQNYKNIRELVDKIKKLLLYTDPYITHYTSLSAAKILIFEGKPFRLSEGTYLNDTSEGRELFNYLSFHATSNRNKETAAEPFAKKPFIGSFVAGYKHDDLTLWRMYGKEAKEEAKGCAITLARDKLLENLIQMKTFDSNTDTSPKANEEFNFYRVAYKKQQKGTQFTIPGAQKEDEDALNAYMNELAERIKVLNKRKKAPEIQNILEALNEIAYLFKTAEYQYEHEVRLVIKDTGFDKIISPECNPPKIHIELTTIRPLLKQITLGPKVERSDEWASAFYYSLDKDEYRPEILISHLPFK